MMSDVRWTPVTRPISHDIWNMYLKTTRSKLAGFQFILIYKPEVKQYFLHSETNHFVWTFTPSLLKKDKVHSLTGQAKPTVLIALCPQFDGMLRPQDSWASKKFVFFKSGQKWVSPKVRVSPPLTKRQWTKVSSRETARLFAPACNALWTVECMESLLLVEQWHRWCGPSGSPPGKRQWAESTNVDHNCPDAKWNLVTKSTTSVGVYLGEGPRGWSFHTATVPWADVVTPTSTESLVCPRRMFGAPQSWRKQDVTDYSENLLVCDVNPPPMGWQQVSCHVLPGTGMILAIVRPSTGWDDLGLTKPWAFQVMLFFSSSFFRWPFPFFGLE